MAIRNDKRNGVAAITLVLLIVFAAVVGLITDGPGLMVVYACVAAVGFLAARWGLSAWQRRR